MRYSKDYYKILHVDPGAEQEIIAFVYKKLARMYHPDVNLSSDAHVKIRDINEAYGVLRDPQRRADYDRWYYAQSQSSSSATSGSTQGQQAHTADGQPNPAYNRPHASRSRQSAQRPFEIWLRRSKHLACLLLLLSLAGWFVWLEWWSNPISCRFQRGRVFHSWLAFTNGSEDMFHDVSFRVDISGNPSHYYYPTWERHETKSILVDRDTMPRIIRINLSSNEQQFKRSCYVKSY